MEKMEKRAISEYLVIKCQFKNYHVRVVMFMRQVWRTSCKEYP